MKTGDSNPRLLAVYSMLEDQETSNSLMREHHNSLYVGTSILMMNAGYIEDKEISFSDIITYETCFFGR